MSIRHRLSIITAALSTAKNQRRATRISAAMALVASVAVTVVQVIIAIQTGDVQMDMKSGGMLTAPLAAAMSVIVLQVEWMSRPGAVRGQA